MKKSTGENEYEGYEILDSLKINPKCYFILDETEFSTWDYSASIIVDADDSLKGEPWLYRYGTTAAKTTCSVTYMANYPLFSYYVNGKSWIAPTDTKTKNKVKAEITKNSAEQTRCLYKDENDVYIFGYNVSAGFVASKDYFGIFGSTDSNSIFKGLFYNFTLTIEGETVYDLVPAKRTADGEFGLLNKVDGKFYENQGSGILERGEENA